MISIAAMSPLRRAIVTPAAARNIIISQHHRYLSMTCARSVDKLNCILEEYRAMNYSQEFPRRFQKDIVHAATTIDYCGGGGAPAGGSANVVSAEAIEHVLRNIGMGHRMSRSEIEGIVSEVGTCKPGGVAGGRDGDGGGASTSQCCVISADQMLDLISKKPSLS